VTAVSEDTRSTRERIVDAAYETLATDGIVNTSARSIAARGGFNQALIFYHFGSVDALLVEAAKQGSARRVEAFRAGSGETSGLNDLVGLATRLHHEDSQTDAVRVLVQMMAAAMSNPEMGSAVLDGFEGWIGFVEEAVASAVAGSPLESVLPVRQVAYAISAMFLGIELIDGLDSERSESDEVFVALGEFGRLVESLGDAIPDRLRPAATRYVNKRAKGDGT
jgi:AcrR family transcriptional regulator